MMRVKVESSEVGGAVVVVIALAVFVVTKREGAEKLRHLALRKS